MLFDSSHTANATRLPAVTRRKKIPGTRRFDKARVFADISTVNFPSTHYQEIFEQNFQPITNKSHAAGRVQKPDPNALSFLYENPRFLNEPICFANSAATKDVQSHWWPKEWKEAPRPTPRFSRFTTFRTDFAPPEVRPKPNTRFACNKSLNTYAVGICPVTDISTGRIKKEQISFEHQFDSRKERRERGKLHGSLVWELEDNIKRNSMDLQIMNRDTKSNKNSEQSMELGSFYQVQQLKSPERADSSR